MKVIVPRKVNSVLRMSERSLSRKKASLITFKMLIPLWVVLLFLCFGLSLLFTDIKIFQITIIGILGGSLIISFLTYLVAWITLDLKD